MILSEYGLEMSNEAAHFKIADLTYSGPITLPTGTALMSVPGAQIGGAYGTAATGLEPGQTAGEAKAEAKAEADAKAKAKDDNGKHGKGAGF
jgi:hypothetical protein